VVSDEEVEYEAAVDAGEHTSRHHVDFFHLNISNLIFYFIFTVLSFITEIQITYYDKDWKRCIAIFWTTFFMVRLYAASGAYKHRDGSRIFNGSCAVGLLCIIPKYLTRYCWARVEKDNFRENHVTGEKLVSRYRTVVRSWRTRGRIQRKTWCMGPYAGVHYKLTVCPLLSRLQYIYHGQPYARVMQCESIS
jgi:hypothetical protein